MLFVDLIKESEYKEEVEKVVSILRELGLRIREVHDKEYSIEEKENKTPVTEVDLMIDSKLRDELGSFDYGFITEEIDESNDRFNKKKIWVIDPIDGTRDFIDKTGDYSIMIGMLHMNLPVLGFVFEPSNNKLYYAEKGKGAFVSEDFTDFKQIKVSDKEELKDYRLVRSRNFFKGGEAEVVEKLGIINHLQRGSIGVKLGLIASGEAEFLIVARKNFCGEWDICAPQVILEEAGGEVYDLEGKVLLYNKETPDEKGGIIATNGKNREKILEILKEMNF